MAQWLKEQGLQRPVDLRYAFESQEEAAAAGGDEVAQLWRQTQQSAAVLPSCWKILAAAKSIPAAEDKVAQPKPVIGWKGLSRKVSKRQLPDGMDASERKRATQWVIKEAKSWSGQISFLRTSATKRKKPRCGPAWRNICSYMRLRAVGQTFAHGLLGQDG